MRTIKIIILALCFGFTTAFGQTVLYVSPHGSSDGSSWSMTIDLEKALQKASSMPPVQIWLSEGTYYPKKTMIVPPSVSLYGGFKGTESRISERNYATHKTIIDAQYQFRVFRLGESAVLNGLSIYRGYAKDDSLSDGGGVFMLPESRIEFCELQDNRAERFGGAISAQGQAYIYQCLIYKNKAKKDASAINGEKLNMRNTTITENEIFSCPTQTPTYTQISICSGESVKLSVQDEPGTYLWSNGSTDKTLESGILLKDTMIRVRYITEDHSCASFHQFDIRVKSLPILSIKTNLSLANAGEECLFTAQASPSGGSYLWDDAKPSRDSFLLVTMPVSGDLSFSCTYEYQGCQSIAQAEIKNSYCTPGVAATMLWADMPSLCVGDSTNLHLVGGEKNSAKWYLYQGACGGSPIDSSSMASPVFKVKPEVNTHYYVRAEGCREQSTCVDLVIQVAPLPAPITGPDTLCLLTQASFQCNTPGGVWGTGMSSIASIGTVSGILNTIQAGSVRIYYTINASGCSRSKQVYIAPAPGNIVGDPSFCQGVERNFSSSPLGGTWKINPSEIASVKNMNTGLIQASKTQIGEAILVYTHPITSCERSVKIKVHPQPQKTIGPSSICQYDTSRFLNHSPGGVWAAYPNTLLSIDPQGYMKSFSSGNALITYSLGQCIDSLPIQILPQLDAISGATHLCEKELTTAFVSGNHGGLWTAVPSTIAKVDSLTGVLSGIKSGFYTLSYTAPNGCKKEVKGEVKSVPGPIIGDSLLGVGQTTRLLNDSAGGTWSSGNTEIAVIGAMDGILNGKKAGKVKIKYQFPIPNSCYVNHSVQIEPCASIYLSSVEYSDHQEVCYKASIDTIRYSLTEASISSIEWFDIMDRPIPAPKGLSYDSIQHFISGASSESGEFHYIVSTKNHFSACPPASIRGQILIYDSVSGGIIKDHQQICIGNSPVEFYSQASGQGGEPFSGSYQWASSTDSIHFSLIDLANSETYNDPLNLLQSKYYRREFIDTRCGSAYSNIVKVEVKPLPLNPIGSVSDNTTCNGVPNGTIEITNPQNGSMYALGSAHFQIGTRFEDLGAGTYTIRVKDSNQCQNTSQYTVNNSNTGVPIIERIDVSPQDSVCENFKGTISLKPVYSNAGFNPAFKWSTGETGEDLIISQISSSTDYILKLTNQETACDGFFTQRITVMPEIHITQNISSKTLCKDALPPSLDLQVKQEGSGRSYQWQQSSNGGSNFSDIPGQTSPSYQVPTTNISSLYYRCLIKTKANICPDLFSNIAQVKVLAIPVIENVLHDTLCGSGVAVLKACAKDANELQWFNVANGGSPVYSGDTANPYVSPFLNTNTSYWVRAYNGYCASTPRQEVKAVLIPLHALELNAGSQNQEVCSGDYMQSTSIAYHGGSSDVNIVWTPQKPTGVNVFKNSGLLSISGQPTDTGMFLWQVISSGNKCSTKTLNGSLRVFSKPKIKILASKDTLCNGDQMLLTASGAVSYQWLSPFVSSNPSKSVNPNVTTVYTLEGTSEKGCVEKQTYTVHVVNPPRFIEPTDGTNHQAVCHRASLSEIRYSLSNASSVAWIKNAVPSSPPQWIQLAYNNGVVSINGTAQESGTISYTLSSVGHSTACPSASVVGTIIVYDSIKGGYIASDQSICFNESPAAFTNISSASGGHPTQHHYQWEISASGDTNSEGAFSNIAFANNETYNEPDNLSATRYYRRAILDAFCNAHVHSNTIKVSVYPLPSVPTYSVIANTACGAIKNGQISVKSPLGANFEYSIDGNLYQSSPNFSQLGQGNYTLWVRNKTTLCTNNTSVFVGSTVISPAVSFTVSPNDSLCSTYSGPVSITANITQAGSNLSYLWSTGATSKDLTLAQAPAVGTSYTLSVTDNTTSCTGTNTQSIVIMPAIQLIKQPIDSTVCVGSNNFSLWVETLQQGSGRIFQWEKSNQAGGPFVNVAADIISATNTFLRISSASSLDEYYRCKVSTAAGICPAVTSQIAHVRVLSIPTVLSVQPDSICGPGIAQLKAYASSVTDSIYWYSNISGNTLLAKTLSGSPFTSPFLSSSTHYYVNAHNTYCASTSRTAVQALVLPLHSIMLSQGPRNQSFCLGEPMATVNHIYNAPITASLSWSPSTPTGLSVANANTLSGTPNQVGTYTWTYTTKGNKCPAQSSSGSIYVKALPPPPTINALSADCDSVLLSATTTAAGNVHYQGTNPSGKDTLSASSLYVKTAANHYFRVYSAESCWGVAAGKAVSILEKPRITGQPSKNDRTPPFVALTLNVYSLSPLTYQWFINTTQSNEGGTAIPGAVNSTYTPSNMQYGNVYYYCEVSNACGKLLSSVSGKHSVIPPPPPSAKQICPYPVKLSKGTTQFLADGFVSTNGNYPVSIFFELSLDSNFLTGVKTFIPNPAIINNASKTISMTIDGMDTDGIWYYRIKAKNADSVYSGIRIVYNNFEMGANEEKIVDAKLYVSDHEKNIYSTILIGTQTWLAENIKSSTRPNGSAIPNLNGETSPYTPYYAKLNEVCYGNLYNWSAAIDTNKEVFDTEQFIGHRRGICPQGWHLPTEDEWCVLEKYIGLQGDCLIGGFRGDSASRLSAQTALWKNSTIKGTPGYSNNANQNNTGFSALPAADYVDKFYGEGELADFWSATKSSSARYAIIRSINHTQVGIFRSASPMRTGTSVRCIKD